MGKDNGQPPIGEAYDTGDEIVILGTPPDFPDSVPEDDGDWLMFPGKSNTKVRGGGIA